MTGCNRQRRIGSRSAGLPEKAAGGLVVVAEGVRDDGSEQSQESLSDGSTADGSDRNTDLAK
ncbi:hypothetical protein GCM10020295_47450 [Streptomyces cinereospinus]